MRTLCLLALLSLLATFPVCAQWTYLGPESTNDHSDFAIAGETILLGINKTTAPVDLYGSNDGGQSWITAFNSGSVRAITPLDTGFLLQIGGQSTYRGDASGRVWTTAPNPGYNVTRYFYDRDSRMLYAATQRGALMGSTNQGESWQSLGVPAQDLTFVHARGNIILTGYHGTGFAAYLSSDMGKTWTTLSTKVTGSPSAGFIAADGSLYLHTGSYIAPGSSALWRSRDGGDSWVELTKSVAGLSGTPILLQSSVYADGPTILFSVGPKFYVSTDDGDTWSERSEGILATGTSSVIQCAIHGGYIYVLHRAFIQPAASYGLYRRPLAELGIGPASVWKSDEAAGIRLDITPNPARESATIGLILERSAATRIAVYDPLGREISVLYDGMLDAGSHHFRWHGVAPAGCYLLGARIDGRTTTRTLLRVE